MKKWMQLALLTLGFGYMSLSQAQSSMSATKINYQQNPKVNHDIFDGLLRKYVNAQGKVDYLGLKKEKAKLDEYLQLLQKNAPSAQWSKGEEMAYWINLYNAFTIQLVLNKYPIKSVMDLDGGKVWTTQTIQVGSEKLTLDQIEKVKLLKRFKEPRVHFAVNCAAASCPPLLNRAWTASNLEANFEAQARAFINNEKFNSVGTLKVEVSKIFEWYADDFGGKDKILSYIQKYHKSSINSFAVLVYKPYDWSLNKQ
jgi:hypothetical protein